jgi:hypothetical protein
MDNLQKTIVAFFILTVLLSIGSLLMFFVEVPYKSTIKCNVTHNSLVDPDAHALNGEIALNGKIQSCTWTIPKEPSAFFDAIVNANIVTGIIFLLLSAYAFYRKHKNAHQPQ